MIKWFKLCKRRRAIPATKIKTRARWEDLNLLPSDVDQLKEIIIHFPE
jgi:hypothetical protein